MKRLRIYLLSLVILLAGCSTPTPAPTMIPQPTSTPPLPTITNTVKPTSTPKPVILSGCVKNNTGSLRVRSAPGTDSDILDRLAAGECISVVGRNSDADWVQVSRNGLSGWVSSDYMDVEGDIKQLAVADMENVASSQPTNSLQIKARNYLLSDFLQAVIDDPKYDPSSSVLHKYINSISINSDNDILTYTILDDIENEDDFISLSYDLILLGALTSNPGKPDDWGIKRIEVISPGPNGSYAKTYVEGATNILGIVENQIKVFDVMEVDVNYGTAQPPSSIAKTNTPRPPTPVVKKTSTPRPEYILCANTGNKIGSYVTCKIPYAYCEYKPSVNGSPTFCNDAPYPSSNFKLIFWDTNRSDLNGKCILVSGYVEEKDDNIPQIVADSSSQVSYCP